MGKQLLETQGLVEAGILVRDLPPSRETRIPCFMLAYFDEDSIRRTINSLAPLDNRLCLHVVENASPSSDTTIARLRLECLKKRRVVSWVRYSQNISGNAILDVLSRGYVDWNEHQYVVLTDGDLECDPGWLDESLSILGSSPDVIAIGVDLRVDNLPVQTFPEARSWVPAGKPHPDGYMEGYTGVHLLTLRTEHLIDFLTYRQRYCLPMLDSTMHSYCRVRRRRWARTSVHKALHITWSIYQDINHPYTQHKLDLVRRGTCWDHQRLADATLYTADGEMEWKRSEGLFRSDTALRRFVGWITLIADIFRSRISRYLSM